MASGIGPLTSVIEAAATSIGAGMLIGGFVAGVLGVALAWERVSGDRRVVRTGYLGGLAAALAAAVDLGLR